MKKEQNENGLADDKEAHAHQATDGGLLAETLLHLESVTDLFMRMQEDVRQQLAKEINRSRFGEVWATQRASKSDGKPN